MNINIKLHSPAAKPPTYGTDGAGCFDLYAASVSTEYGHNRRFNIDTGVSFEIPAGWAMLIFSRSGHGFTSNTRLANCVGVIDSDYRGTVKVKLTCDDHSTLPTVSEGSRVAQAMLVPVQRISFSVTDELSETARGTGGLGSTGN